MATIRITFPVILEPGLMSVNAEVNVTSDPHIFRFLILSYKGRCEQFSIVRIVYRCNDRGTQYHPSSTNMTKLTSAKGYLVTV